MTTVYAGDIGNKLRKFIERRQEQFEEVLHDDDGFWAYTAKGWANPEDHEYHTYHEYTATALMAAITDSKPTRCSCQRCQETR